jgi:dolichyl-diphosphooligosaccharide--protein glycosyltransferase
MKFDGILEVLGLREESKTLGFARFVLKYWWVWCLIAITLFSFWTRMIPAKYGELQALDPFYAYRMNLYMLDHNLQLPLHDDMRYWPDGVDLGGYGTNVYFYVPVVLYLALGFFGVSMTYLEFAIMYPALMGAFSVFIVFWLAREIFHDNNAGLFSALFLATVPAYIARTSAGFFDKEATGGAFLLLTVFLFMRAYNTKSWKLSVLSMVSIFLAVGSWGGAQFVIYIIGIPMLIMLVINRYTEKMLIAGPLPLVSAALTQNLFVGTGITLEQMLAFLVTALIITRSAAEKYKVVKEEQLPYLIPGILVLIMLFVLVGSMFNDFMWYLVNRATSLLFLQQKSVIGTTVAEQMEGTWSDVTGRTSISFSKSLLPIGAPFDTLLSVWFLMILGSLMMIYDIYTERRWMLLLPLAWLLMSIQTVFFMVRLVFFLGPPTAIVAGFFAAEMIRRVSGWSYMKRRKGLGKINAVSILLIAFVALLITANLATGYVFCNSVGPSFNQYWSQAMDFLKAETPVNSSILSWWDFGYWFQTRGNRPSTADGGNINGSVNEQIADWYVSDASNWTDFRWWYRGKDVDYILMDYTLPGKYGAISKIASRGKNIVGMLQFQQTGIYPQENRTIVEYKAGQYTVWIPVGNNGNIAGNPIFMISQGDQYLGRNYITDVCTTEGIIRLGAPEGSDTMPGCVTITAYGLFYIPPEAEFSIFTNLMFMDGYGIPDVEKVYDNQLIKIYRLEINETA